MSVVKSLLLFLLVLLARHAVAASGTAVDNACSVPLRFVPLDEMEAEGYAEYIPLVTGETHNGD